MLARSPGVHQQHDSLTTYYGGRQKVAIESTSGAEQQSGSIVFCIPSIITHAYLQFTNTTFNLVCLFEHGIYSHGRPVQASVRMNDSNSKPTLVDPIVDS